jgi:hypothetical protein
LQDKASATCHGCSAGLQKTPSICEKQSRPRQYAGFGAITLDKTPRAGAGEGADIAKDDIGKSSVADIGMTSDQALMRR